MRYLNKAPSPGVITRSNFLAIFVLRVIRIPIASASGTCRSFFPNPPPPRLLFLLAARMRPGAQRVGNFHDVLCTGNTNTIEESRPGTLCTRNICNYPSYRPSASGAGKLITRIIGDSIARPRQSAGPCDIKQSREWRLKAHHYGRGFFINRGEFGGAAMPANERLLEVFS